MDFRTSGMRSFLSEFFGSFIIHWRPGLPGRIKLALGSRLATASLRRIRWVTVRLTNQMNLRNTHSKGSPTISLLFSTTLVAPKQYVLSTDYQQGSLTLLSGRFS